MYCCDVMSVFLCCNFDAQGCRLIICVSFSSRFLNVCLFFAFLGQEKWCENRFRAFSNRLLKDSVFFMIKISLKNEGHVSTGGGWLLMPCAELGMNFTFHIL